ncbi:MAG: hypothetical protein VW405_07100 [Rhodospirillaceae bacterium]
MALILDGARTVADALGQAVGHHLAGRYAKAEALYRLIVDRHPDNAQAHANLGMLRLLMGDFAEGWAEFGWRRHGQAGQLARWRGEPLDGRRILVRGEQGAGDNIQFLRYLPFLRDRGGEPVVLTLPGMTRLLGALDGAGEVLEPGNEVSGLACEVPVMDLPEIAGTRLEKVPATIPYLRAEPALVEAWAARLGPRERRRVGLCWQGNPGKPRDAERSIPLARFRHLFDTPDTEWFGLQVGAGEDQVLGLGAAPNFTHLGAHLGVATDKFVDAAAVIAQLDLVVTVDTAIAHLAGAMGVAVWILLPQVPDWRWMLGRDDSPWYPSARLFRQTAAGDWDAPLSAVAAALAA